MEISVWVHIHELLTSCVKVFIHVCFHLFWCVDGLVAVVHSALTCQFWYVPQRHMVCSILIMHTCTHSVSLVPSTVSFGKQFDGAAPKFIWLYRSCRGVIVIEFLYNYWLQTDDGCSQRGDRVSADRCHCSAEIMQEKETTFKKNSQTPYVLLKMVCFCLSWHHLYSCIYFLKAINYI